MDTASVPPTPMNSPSSMWLVSILYVYIFFSVPLFFLDFCDYLSIYSQDSVAKWLVEHGIELQKRDKNGWTPILCAINANNLHMVEVRFHYTSLSISLLYSWPPLSNF